MPTLTVPDLDTLVAAVYKYGFSHPEVTQHIPITLKFASVVDESLDPFSDAYFAQQVALYEEISGRRLNQESGELHLEDDTTALLTAPNPLGIVNVAHTAEHVRALSTMLSLSGLGERPKVLDMGAGHGLSSEVFAFCGCRVHAVDIDPNLGTMSTKRALARNLDIVRSEINYDDLSAITTGNYEAAFFFQSLHHCLRPWDLIEQLKGKLTAGGVIAFTGEPLQTAWWKHWGVRLDHESLFVARARGWFESGWSHDFIRECFTRNGLEMRFYSGGHGGGEIGFASEAPRRLDAIAARVAFFDGASRSLQAQ